jgi:hypothetical protein
MSSGVGDCPAGPLNHFSLPTHQADTLHKKRMSSSSQIKGLPKPKPVTVAAHGGGGGSGAGSTESIRDFFPAAPKKTTSRPELELLTAPNVFPKPSAPQGDVLPPSMRAQAQIIKSRAENLTKAAVITPPPGALSSSSSSVAPPQAVAKKVVEAPPVKKQQQSPSPPPPPPAKAPLVSKPGLTEAEARAAAIAVVQARKEAAAAAAVAAPAAKPAKKQRRAKVEDSEGESSDEYDSLDEKFDKKEREGVDLADDVSDEDFAADADEDDDDDNYGIDNQIAEDDDDADAVGDDDDDEEEEDSGDGADDGDGEAADPMDVDQEGEEQIASNEDDVDDEDDEDADDNEREPDDLAALTTFLVNERLTKKQRAALPVLTTAPSAPPSPPVKKAPSPPPPAKPAAAASAPKAKAGAAAQVDTLATCYKRYGIDAPIPVEVETELHFAMRTMQEYYNKILVSASFAKTQSAPAAQSVGTRLAPVLEVRARNSRDLNKSMLYMQSLVEEGLEEMDALIAY